VFCRYLQPFDCIVDKVNEFLEIKFQESLRLYGLQPMHTRIDEPQANFVESIHQTLGNMNCACILEIYDFGYNDP
jgi:hypothetical protein